MISLPMPVNGFGDLYEAFFNAIARAFGCNIFESFRSISILLAGFTVLASLVLHRDIFSVVKWLIYFYVVVYIGFLPKATLEIVDHIGSKPYRVSNVPLGLALAASLSSQLSDSLTTLMEMNFSMPNDITYRQTGMIFSAQLMKAASQFEITNPRIDANIQGFIKQCVFYDLRFRKYSMSELVACNDIWAFLKTQRMSPVRGFEYTYPDRSTAILTCREAFPLLDKDWKEALDVASWFYGSRIFAKENNPAKKLTEYLPISVGFLAKLADSQANAIMKQTMMANAIERGALYMGAKVDANAALKSFSVIRAQAQKRLTNQTVGEMACYWLPLIKVSLELILYGSFIFVILIAVFPFGQKTLKGYLSTLLWVQLWPPVFSLFHLIISYYGCGEMSKALIGGISMQNLTSMAQISSDLVGLAGYMSMSVPAVAGFVLWGAQHSFAQVSQYIGGVTQSASSQAATELASGNISLGNTSFGNHNAFNTSNNKYDSNMRVAGGASSLQLADGTQLSHMADGSDVINMQGAISSLPMQVDLLENYRASFNRSAEHAQSAALQNQHAFGHNVHSQAREVNSLSHHVSKMEAAGESWSKNASSSVSHAFSEIEKTNNEIQERTGLTHQKAEALSASLYAEAKGGVSVGIPTGLGLVKGSIGGGVGYSRNATDSDSNVSSHTRDAAKSIMDSHQYAKNMDTVTRAIRDQSFRMNSETGDRLVEDIGSSLEHADFSRQEYSANLQKADNFRKAATLSSEKGAGFRDNLAQEFVEYVARQPNQYGTSEIGASNVNNVLKDPHLKEHYIHGFIQHKVHNFESNWMHDLAASHHAIQKIHDSNYATMGNDQHIEVIHKSNMGLQKTKSDVKGINMGQKIDDSARGNVEQQIDATKRDVLGHKTKINQEKLAAEKTHHNVADNYKRHGKVHNQTHGIQDPEDKK